MMKNKSQIDEHNGYLYIITAYLNMTIKSFILILFSDVDNIESIHILVRKRKRLIQSRILYVIIHEYYIYMIIV